MHELLPDGFLFGASTSAHQIEGNNVSSDWWAFENAPGSPVTEPSGDACDSFLRWREDMDLLRSLGFDSYRFSVEWARVEPVRGRISNSAVAHYVDMVEYARRVGLEPVVTLHHFTHPLWFMTDGGWLADDALDRFQRYLDAVAPVLDAGVRTAVTINEPNILAVMHAIVRGEAELEGGLLGGLPAPHRPTAERLAAAHRLAVDHLHRRHPGVRAGWTIANQAVQSTPDGDAVADDYRRTREDWFIEQSRGDDFIGVQSYTRTIMGREGIVPVAPEVERTLTGWEYYPAALEEAVRHTAEVAPGMPIIVTENGVAVADDERRIDYTRRALRGLARAMADGIDVHGYLHWSALDNYEWGRFAPTFGLIAVDRTAFVRTPKPSAFWLGSLARRRMLVAPQAEGEAPRDDESHDAGATPATR
ncbi:glycoside hydrolase family 1 protein [Humibacter ginsenosidimutans]|uniref:Family 1 glycosylhydrolase n=1 Tax=Humibacter ginsenosidimutans TaxID=2599293 RepID=A0A5B8M6V1_9MICO|nr:family 1 glycosylhydrolase [Humibacter ginsenosidimutans]QDZ15322.1 family 1 glycosylhydrolase [Humibacter ginsenosidimutans]